MIHNEFNLGDVVGLKGNLSVIGRVKSILIFNNPEGIQVICYELNNCSRRFEETELILLQYALIVDKILNEEVDKDWKRSWKRLKKQGKGYIA